MVLSAEKQLVIQNIPPDTVPEEGSRDRITKKLHDLVPPKDETSPEPTEPIDPLEAKKKRGVDFSSKTFGAAIKALVQLTLHETRVNHLWLSITPREAYDRTLENLSLYESLLQLPDFSQELAEIQKYLQYYQQIVSYREKKSDSVLVAKVQDLLTQQPNFNFNEMQVLSLFAGLGQSVTLWMPISMTVEVKQYTADVQAIKDWKQKVATLQQEINQKTDMEEDEDAILQEGLQLLKREIYIRKPSAKLEKFIKKIIAEIAQKRQNLGESDFRLDLIDQITMASFDDNINQKIIELAQSYLEPYINFLPSSLQVLLCAELSKMIADTFYQPNVEAAGNLFLKDRMKHKILTNLQDAKTAQLSSPQSQTFEAMRSDSGIFSENGRVVDPAGILKVPLEQRSRILPQMIAAGSIVDKKWHIISDIRTTLVDLTGASNSIPKDIEIEQYNTNEEFCRYLWFMISKRQEPKYRYRTNLYTKLFAIIYCGEAA